MEETALQYCQRLIELITLGDKDISIKSRLIHLKNKIEDESRPVQAGVMQNYTDTWQLCPKCNGQGIVSKPPHVAGDQQTWSSSSAIHTCDVCNGMKIIKQ